eukprot:4337802-Pleurochrysis_carterae.AAC.2
MACAARNEPTVKAVRATDWRSHAVAHACATSPLPSTHPLTPTHASGVQPAPLAPHLDRDVLHRRLAEDALDDARDEPRGRVDAAAIVPKQLPTHPHAQPLSGSEASSSASLNTRRLEGAQQQRTVTFLCRVVGTLNLNKSHQRSWTPQAQMIRSKFE